MPKKRILLCSEWFRPAFKAGGPIVSVYNLAKTLSNNFEVLVLAGSKDLFASEVLPGVIENQIQEVEGIQVYFTSFQTINKSFLEKLHKTYNPELVWLSGMFSYHYSILPLLYFKGKTKLVLSPRGMLHDSALKVKSLKKKLFLNFFRLKGIHKRLVWHATNEEEQAYIIKQFGKNITVFVQPNLAKTFNEQSRITHKKAGELRLLVLARIAREKNPLFALKALEHSKNQGIAMHFFGNDGGGEYSKQFFTKLQSLKQQGYDVEYFGTVSPINLDEEVFPGYHYMYLPSSGENFGHAISDALANSTPVFISDRTPWNEIAEHGAKVVQLNVAEHANALQELFLEDETSYTFNVQSQIDFFRKNTSLNNAAKEYCNFVEQL